jgi:hypothetical protein
MLPRDRFHILIELAVIGEVALGKFLDLWIAAVLDRNLRRVLFIYAPLGAPCDKNVCPAWTKCGEVPLSCSAIG